MDVGFHDTSYFRDDANILKPGTADITACSCGDFTILFVWDYRPVLRQMTGMIGVF